MPVQNAAAALMKTVTAARTDFRVFVEKVWANVPDFQLAPFHLEAIDAFCNPEDNFVYWEAARGHFKTGLAMAYACWTLGRDQNSKIKIICASDKEARKRLYEIKQQIEKNRLLHMVFPKLRKPKAGEWNKSRIIVDREKDTKDPSIEAMGVMSGSLGSRATLIILDDIVDVRNSILQPQLRDHVNNKVFGEIVPLLEPKNSKLIGIATPWTLTDCNARMKENATFRTVGPHPVGDGVNICAPIWPYMVSEKHLKRQLGVLGPAEYARAYLCQALTKDTVPIQPQWIQFYDANLLGDPYEMVCLQSYDLAIEVSDANDYFGHVTVLWDQKRDYVFVTDGRHDRISFDTQAQTVIDDARLWQPQWVIIEKGGYQGALSSHLSAKTDIALPIWPFAPRGRSKERRVVEAQPVFENKRVFFHPKFDPRTNPDIKHTAPIVEELISFPFGKWDDLVDALVQALLVIIELSPGLGASSNETEVDLTII